MNEDELRGKWVVGEFVEKDATELSELLESAKG